MTFKKLVKEIYEYESDTFSSHASKITLLEAEKIAERLIEGWAGEYLDGVSIHHHLMAFRDL